MSTVVEIRDKVPIIGRTIYNIGSVCSPTLRRRLDNVWQMVGRSGTIGGAEMGDDRILKGVQIPTSGMLIGHVMTNLV